MMESHSSFLLSQLSSCPHFCIQQQQYVAKTSRRIRLTRLNPWSPITQSEICLSVDYTRKLSKLQMPNCRRGLWVERSGKCRTTMSTMSNTCTSERLAGRLFGPGEEGENWWDDKCLFHPIVVKDPSSSSWRMYYYGRNRDSWHSGVTPALLSTGRIGLALSEDGLRWTRYRGALPEGAILDPDDGSPSFDSVHIGCSDVFFHEGEWWMFYFGGSAEKMEFGRGRNTLQGFRMLPGVIKSENGLEFDRQSSPGRPLLDVGKQNEFDEVFIAWPRVVPPSNEPRPHFSNVHNQWLMTYSSIQKTSPQVSSIGAAISSNGAQWIKVGAVLTRGDPGSWDEAGVGRRHVIFIDGHYVMFYEGVDKEGVHGIGLAFSRNGIHWEKDSVNGSCPGGPVFSARIGEDAWDNGTVAAPHVVRLDDGRFRLYYVGSNSSKQESAIGVAESNGIDFRSWIRPTLVEDKDYAS